jgi:capsular polysaccharide biosynthesis protein
VKRHTKRRTPRRTRWIAGLLIVFLTAAGGAGGWELGRIQGPEYQATTEVLVQFWSINGFLLTGQGTSVSPDDVADAATLATSTEVLAEAATALGDGRSVSDLAAEVTATPDTVSHGVTVTATGSTADAARLASAEVASAMIDSVDAQISDTANSLADTSDSEFASQVRQRAEVLRTSVRPLQELATGTPKQTAPTLKLPIALAVVGLALGVLIVIALTFARPVVGRARDVQRLVELPAAPFEQPLGGADASRLVRRILDTRETGSILVVPVDAAAEKSASAFADWARARTRDAAEAVRIVTSPEPAGTVLGPRPVNGSVGAVVLLAPQGTPRRTLVDAVALMSTWRPVDAVVVPA